METFEGRRNERKRREETRVGAEVERERGDERTRTVGENKRWSLWAKGPVVVFPSEVEEEDERNRS